MTFNKWLDTLIEEKGLNPEMTFQVQGVIYTHIITLGVIVEQLKASDRTVQAQFKTKAVQIDFLNGDLVPFLKHLAKGMAVQVDQSVAVA